MSDVDLRTPPTEAEVADLLKVAQACGPALHSALRRLAFQRDCLLAQRAAVAGLVAAAKRMDALYVRDLPPDHRDYPAVTALRQALAALGVYR
jgi:hypothetical protein